MNDPSPAAPSPTKSDPAALVLEFQRLTARLARAKVITPDEASRLVRALNRASTAAKQRHAQLAELVFQILLSLEDATLKEGEHFLRLPDEHVGLHPDAVATALYRAKRGQELLRREVRSLLVLGAEQFPDVVPDRAARVRFNSDGDRRRVVVLHVPSARKFVGDRPRAVPAR